MTKENCVKLLNQFKDTMNNNKLGEGVRGRAKRNYENMKKHILGSGKFNKEEKEVLLKGDK